MSKTSKLRPPFKCLNNKYYLCEWIIQHFPEKHEEMVYLEPFCGAASVLANKPISAEEAINDIDQGIIKIIRTIRDQTDEFIDILRKTQYTKETFDNALEKKNFANDLEEAANEFILRRMSRGGTKEVFAWSNRQRGGKPGDQNAWETIIKCIPKIAKRIEHVYIFNKPASEVLNAFNKTNTLAYIDPPTPDEESELLHVKLADILRAYKGKVIISNHPSALYNRLYKAWRSAKKKPKTGSPECLWMNY